MTYTPTGLIPTGAIMPFLKSLANTPSLPDGWVECNGQVLSDTQSVYNGQTIPDLNITSGVPMFLRGDTSSGGTGGWDTQCGHGFSVDAVSILVGACVRFYPVQYCNTGIATALPSYCTVVWVMNVKGRAKVPVGAVAAFLKDFANTPSLPDGYVECDGTVLSNSQSVYNGQTIPNLNNHMFLRGDATSGGGGGVDMHKNPIAVYSILCVGGTFTVYGVPSAATEDSSPLL